MNYKNFVKPKVKLIGYTTLDILALKEYLEETDQLEFLDQINNAIEQGINPGEILCSFYAKLCYASLTTKKNKNISKVREIYDNILGILDSGHGSVIEHCYLNFVCYNVSRVFTHELVRHRVGTAFSQTSGRYVRTDELNLVIDPILEPIYEDIEEARLYLENWYKKVQDKLKMDEMKDFSVKKKWTSALRRILPNGLSNEIGFSVNLRSLRHTIQMRTSRHSEWEIRAVFNQIAHIIKNRYPAIMSDAKFELVDGLDEIIFKNPKI